MAHCAHPDASNASTAISAMLKTRNTLRFSNVFISELAQPLPVASP